MKRAITDIRPADLPGFVAELGMKKYAADQILTWLYGRLVTSFGEMTNISKAGRKRLEEECDISALDKMGKERAKDGTLKLLCETRDGERVECVLLQSEGERLTACLSTQAGCAMGCDFCRTAGMGLKRNLTLGEITGQLVLLSREANRSITNIVLMGMGEPLLNRETVEDAIAIFRDEEGFCISKRRITLSTSGVMPELEKFAANNDIKIAISLNATTDEVRDKLMPVNRKWPIAEIMDFSRKYNAKSRHRITFEYVMIRDINDTREDAERLAMMLQSVNAKVNLIPLNPFEGSAYKAPDPENVIWWREYLAGKGIQVNIRVSRGQEILAACGQLASRGVTRNS